MQYSIPDLLDCAVGAATAAGRHALGNSQRRKDALSITRHDIKLKLDVECQNVAVGMIHSRYPGAVVLGEEDQPTDRAHSDGVSANSEWSELEWVIDPIDGTVNFYHGLPLWCCSIAARKAGKSLVGVVFAPELDVLYTATIETPSTANDKPIHVSDTSTIADALFLTSLNQKLDTDLSANDVLMHISGKVRKTRVLGAAALDICRVAQGQADAYWEPGNYTWDVAAAGLIARQAGGTVGALHMHQEPHRMSYLATNGLLYEDFSRILSDFIPP